MHLFADFLSLHSMVWVDDHVGLGGNFFAHLQLENVRGALK